MHGTEEEAMKIAAALVAPSGERGKRKASPVLVLSRPPQDPEAGVHVARIDELRRGVVGDAPDLRRVREDVPLRRLDRVLVRRRHEIRDLAWVARILRADDADAVRV